jgi:hypothetical protein
MNNSIERQKSIEQIRKEFHIVANNPPAYNPFTSEGNESWGAWADRCRNYESLLRENGEDF